MSSCLLIDGEKMPVKKNEKKIEDNADDATGKTAVENSKVKVEYEGFFDDGEVFDNSGRHGEPMVFEIGAKQVIAGFENAVKGMKIGEEKQFRLEAKDAYGEPNPKLEKQIPKEQVPSDKEILPGMMLIMSLPNGMEMPAKIIAVDDEFLTIDLNHPLAGKALNFKIKLIEIL